MVNKDTFDWKKIPVSKSIDRERFDNLVEARLPEYKDTDFKSLRKINPYRKSVKSFHKYQEDVSVKDTHADSNKFLESMNFIDVDEEALREALRRDEAYDKMRAWQEGSRGFNSGAASLDKLFLNYAVCKDIGFHPGMLQIYAEIKKRDKLKELTAYMNTWRP